MASYLALEELVSAFEALVGERGEIAVLIAAHNGSVGPREVLHAAVVRKRRGTYDSRYRAERIGTVAIMNPDERDQVLAALADRAAMLGVPFFAAEGPAIAIAADAWIRARGPAPEVDWTTEWSWCWHDQSGVEQQTQGAETVRARTAIEARSRCVPSFPAGLPGTQTVRSVELDECFTVRFAGEPGSLSSVTLRGLSVQGARVSSILAAHPPRSPLDAMISLASAWDATLSEVAPAGAYVRGALGLDEADEILGRVRDAHRSDWMFAVRVQTAVEQGHVDRTLLDEARRRDPALLMRALEQATYLGGRGSMKQLLGTLDRLGDELLEPGALGRTLDELRIRRS